MKQRVFGLPLVAKYSGRLEPSVQHEKPSDAEAAKRVVWQDSGTRFGLSDLP